MKEIVNQKIKGKKCKKEKDQVKKNHKVILQN